MILSNPREIPLLVMLYLQRSFQFVSVYPNRAWLAVGFPSFVSPEGPSYVRNNQAVQCFTLDQKSHVEVAERRPGMSWCKIERDVRRLPG